MFFRSSFSTPARPDTLPIYDIMLKNHNLSRLIQDPYLLNIFHYYGDDKSWHFSESDPFYYTEAKFLSQLLTLIFRKYYSRIGIETSFNTNNVVRKKCQTQLEFLGKWAFESLTESSERKMEDLVNSFNTSESDLPRTSYIVLIEFLEQVNVVYSLVKSDIYLSRVSSQFVLTKSSFTEYLAAYHLFSILTKPDNEISASDVLTLLQSHFEKPYFDNLITFLNGICIEDAEYKNTGKSLQGICDLIFYIEKTLKHDKLSLVMRCLNEIEKGGSFVTSDHSFVQQYRTKIKNSFENCLVDTTLFLNFVAEARQNTYLFKNDNIANFLKSKLNSTRSEQLKVAYLLYEAKQLASYHSYLVDLVHADLGILSIVLSLIPTLRSEKLQNEIYDRISRQCWSLNELKQSASDMPEWCKIEMIQDERWEAIIKELDPWKQKNKELIELFRSIACTPKPTLSLETDHSSYKRTPPSFS